MSTKFSIKNSNEKIIFRDVHVFVNRIKNFVVIHETKLIRNILYRYLQKNALTWHTTLLFVVEKRLLTINNNFDEWETTLVTKFKKFSIKIMNAFVTKRYTMKNVVNHRSFRNYVQTINRFDKLTKLFLWNQLFQI